MFAAVCLVGLPCYQIFTRLFPMAPHYIAQHFIQILHKFTGRLALLLYFMLIFSLSDISITTFTLAHNFVGAHNILHVTFGWVHTYESLGKDHQERITGT